MFIEAREAMVGWLGQEPFDFFLTVTQDMDGTLLKPKRKKLLTEESRVWFVPRRAHPEQVLKRVMAMREIFNRDRYGRQWKKRDSQAMSCVIGIERHKSGGAHAHILGRVPGGFTKADCEYWEPIFTATGGICRLEIPRCQNDTVSYVCKYVIKDDSLDFSQNFVPVRRELELALPDLREELRNTPVAKNKREARPMQGERRTRSRGTRAGTAPPLLTLSFS